MNDVKSYSPPFALDKALDGGAVGEVIASRSAALKEGDVVVHSLGWREYAVLDAEAVKPARTDLAPMPAFLGALGMTGLTAYAGLLPVAEFKAGDAVFASMPPSTTTTAPCGTSLKRQPAVTVSTSTSTTWAEDTLRPPLPC